MKPIANFEAGVDERAVLAHMSQSIVAVRRGGAADESFLQRSIGDLAQTAPALYGAICQAVDVLAEGAQLSVAATTATLTTGEAARFLDISRPYVVKLLEDGRLPFTVVGTHRRIRFDHLVAFRAEREARQQAVRRLTELYVEDDAEPQTERMAASAPAAAMAHS